MSQSEGVDAKTPVAAVSLSRKIGESGESPIFSDNYPYYITINELFFEIFMNKLQIFKKKYSKSMIFSKKSIFFHKSEGKELKIESDILGVGGVLKL